MARHPLRFFPRVFPLARAGEVCSWVLGDFRKTQRITTNTVSPCVLGQACSRLCLTPHAREISLVASEP